jgi:acyl-CoA synthetase (AMP-forming)/AMP-acid ligase II
MPWSLGDVIREQARRRGDGPMMTYGTRTITWSEMDARASRVAQALVAAGLAEQSRVALLDKNGPEFFEVLLGGGKANIVNVAVNGRLTPAEMAYVINDAGARMLVVGPDFIGWVELRIVEPGGRVCAPGEVGEVWTRSVQNFKGYWGGDEETARTLDTDGWLRTGDAGFLDEDGYLFLTDRVKDMIISGSENVYPAEVENVLSDHPAIADAADVIAFARERLAHFKCSTSVDFVESLPRNPSGKVLKRALREPYWQGRARHID